MHSLFKGGFRKPLSIMMVNNRSLVFRPIKANFPCFSSRLGQIPRKPAILYFCRQSRGKVGKHALLDENYALNTKKLFTRPDFEFLTVKLQLKITDPNTGHENEAKLFSFVEVSFESKYLSKSAYYLKSFKCYDWLPGD